MKDTKVPPNFYLRAMSIQAGMGMLMSGALALAGADLVIVLGEALVWAIGFAYILGQALAQEDARRRADSIRDEQLFALEASVQEATSDLVRARVERESEFAQLRSALALVERAHERTQNGRLA